MTNSIRFEVEPFEGAMSIVPFVDGNSFPAMVAAFEKKHGYSPAGGYGGIIPAHLDLGDLESHFLGTGKWPRSDATWLLGCDCGEVGCWPLEADVDSDDTSVSWTRFRQPFRPDRDYEGFGPFMFDRQEYVSTLSEVISTIGS